MCAEPSPQTTGSKSGLITMIVEKRRAFAAEASSPEGVKILEGLELLQKSLEHLSDDRFTPQYCQNVLQCNPSLSMPSLAKALEGAKPVKATRRRNITIHHCEECDGPLVDGVCANCGHYMRVLDTTEGRSKTSSDASEKMSQFDADLDILLAITALPMSICSKAQEIVNVLTSHGITITKGVQIPPDAMRAAFASTGLNKHFIWCNAMGYYLSEWRPKPFEANDRALILEYYQRAVQAFSKRMCQVGPDGNRLMANMWCVQANVKMILMSSPSLRVKYYVFYASLHDQNQNTVESHCNIWNKIAMEEGWQFK